MRNQGYSLEARAAEVLEGLGIPTAVHRSPMSTLSGGFKLRVLLGQVLAAEPGALLLDEPTNHLDLEAIDALVDALTEYDGTLIFVSHDRWFVSRLANRILEISSKGLNDFRGTYDEYLDRCGDDHLDAEGVLLKLRKERREKTAERKEPEPKRQNRLRALERKRDELAARIEAMEARVHDISERFLDPALFGRGAQAELRQLENEQKQLKAKIDEATTAWGEVEAELEAAGPTAAARPSE